MPNNSIPNETKLPVQSANEDTQDNELPKANADDNQKPPVNMGGSRQSGLGVTDADPSAERADQKDHIPAPQFSNRE